MGISGSAGQRWPLPPSPRRFHSQRARLWGGKGGGVRAGLPCHGTKPLPKGMWMPAPPQINATASLGGSRGQFGTLSLYPTFPCCYMGIFGMATTTRWLEKLFCLFFTFFSRKQPCPRAITHHLLQCHPHFPAEREKRGVSEEGRAAARSQQRGIIDLSNHRITEFF